MDTVFLKQPALVQACNKPTFFAICYFYAFILFVLLDSSLSFIHLFSLVPRPGLPPPDSKMVCAGIRHDLPAACAASVFRAMPKMAEEDTRLDFR